MRLFPSKITAGLSFALTLNLPSYPAGIWTLRAYLRGPKGITLESTQSGVEHVFSAVATDTAAWIPGEYWLSLRAANGSDVAEICSEQLRIFHDLAQAPDGYDGRTDDEIALDNIDAVISKRATQDQQRYSINNRELWRTPIHELIKLRAVLQSRVAKAKACGRFGRIIPVRFTT